MKTIAFKMKVANKMMERAIVDVAGEDVLPLVQLLKNKKNVSEFKLAEMMKREINETRNMLYRLYHNNLVSFTRKKDKQKGWYIYYWTFRPKQLKFTVVGLKKKRLEKLGERLKRERENYYFICPNKCMRLDIEQATGFDYKCPECGQLMQQEDNAKLILNIEKEVKELEKELGKV